MVEKILKQDWLDPHKYDIVFNTEVIIYEEAADLIPRAIRKKKVS